MPFSKPHYFYYALSFLFISALALLFSITFPFYQGPDEQIHYATLQHHSEPKEKTWDVTQDTHTVLDGSNISTFHLSEEILRSTKMNQFDEIKWQGENTASFVPNSFFGNDEIILNQSNFKRYIDIYPANTSTNTSYYYWITSVLERQFSDIDIIDRFFLMRLFSLFLLVGTFITTFIISRKIFVSSLEQTLFTLLVIFQPMLLATGTIVNIDIALIFGTSLFFLGALSILQKSSYWNHLLIFAGLLIAFLGKAPGVAFAPIAILLYLYLIQRKYHFEAKNIVRFLFLALSSTTLLFCLLIRQGFFISFLNLGVPSKFSSPLASLATYLDKTFGVDAFLRTHASYWGNFGWLDTKMHTSLLHSIAFIELVAWIGILLFIFSQKTKNYLPKKAIIILSLGMIFFLQLAIRFYDWRVFDTTGKIVIGTPGRYFLPTLIPHLIILVTGLGFLITKNKTQFTTLLKALALSMILLCLYAVFDVIIPRYYL